MLSISYLGPDIGHAQALELEDHIVHYAEHKLVYAIAIVIVNSKGVIIKQRQISYTDVESSLVLAEGKAITALEFMKDTIEIRHTWDQRGLNPGEGEWVELGSGLSESDIANFRKAEPRFTNLAGGVLIRSEHNGAVVGAVGVVTDLSEFIDHDMASQRPRHFAVAA